MPAQKRVGRDDGGDLAQAATAQAVRPHGQPAPVVIGQRQASTPQLPAQHTILFDEIAEYFSLLAVQPPARTASNSWSAAVSITAGIYITESDFMPLSPVDPALGHYGCRRFAAGTISGTVTPSMNRACSGLPRSALRSTVARLKFSRALVDNLRQEPERRLVSWIRLTPEYPRASSRRPAGRAIVGSGCFPFRDAAIRSQCGSFPSAVAGAVAPATGPFQQTAAAVSSSVVARGIHRTPPDARICFSSSVQLMTTRSLPPFTPRRIMMNRPSAVTS